MIHGLGLTIRIAALGGTWLLLGWQLLPQRVRRGDDALLRWTTAFGLGCGFTAIALTLMAAFHLFGRSPVRGLALVELILAVAVAVAHRHELRSDLRVARSASRLENAGWLVLGLLLALTLFATWAPPSAHDATVYHLRAPREFLRTGAWSKLEQVQSFQPLNVEMLFAEALAVDGGALAGLVHWLLGVLAAASAGCWARRFGGRAVWGAVVFAATGLWVWEATSPFIDLGLTAFSSLSLFWAVAAPLDLPAAVLAGLFGGIAGGAKFTGLVFAAMCAVAALAIHWPEVRAGLRRMGVVGITALGVASPWYVRDWLLTGNPIYPLANRLFGLPPLRLSVKTYGLGSDPLHLLSSPFDLLARGLDFDQGWAIGPAYLAFVPLGALLIRSRLARLVIACLVAWWILWFYSSPQTRLLMPILPAVAGLAAVAIGACLASPGLPVRVATLAVLAIGVVGGLGTAALYDKATSGVILGRESPEAYLTRMSRNYTAYQRANSLLPADARVASVGFGDNLFYLDRPAVWLGPRVRPSTAELQARGFTHELLICGCPTPPLEDSRSSLVESGQYDLIAGRLSGGVERTMCYRLSAISPPEAPRR